MDTKGTHTKLPASVAVLVPLEGLEPVSKEAILVGTLVIHNKCVKVHQENSDTLYSLVAPPSYQLASHDNQVVVVRNDTIVGVVNQKVTVSGGAISTINSSIRCEAPYWLVGETFKQI